MKTVNHYEDDHCYLEEEVKPTGLTEQTLEDALVEIGSIAIRFHYCDSCGWSIKTKDKDLSIACVSGPCRCGKHGLSFVGMTQDEYIIMSSYPEWERDIRPAITYLKCTKVITKALLTASA